METPSLTTPRLSLRPLEPADALILHGIYQMEGVLKYFPNPSPPPLEKVGNLITGQKKHWAEHGYGNWGLLLNGEKEIIGWVGLQYLPELDETEVGFLLSPHPTGVRATPPRQPAPRSSLDSNTSTWTTSSHWFTLRILPLGELSRNAE